MSVAQAAQGSHGRRRNGRGQFRWPGKAL